MEQGEGGILDKLFDRDEEGNGLFAVDQAVIVGEGEVHHRPNFHLIPDGDRALLDGMKTEDGGLGWIEDGSGENGSVDATIRDGEDATEQVGEREFSVARPGGDRTQSLFETSEVELIAIAQHGNDEALFGANGHPDIEVVLGHDFVSLNSSIEGGHRFEGVDGGLEKEAHEPQLDAVLGLKRGLNFGAKGDEVGKVSLVKGGENRGGVLGADEAIGNFSAEGRHFFAGFAVGTRRVGRNHGGVCFGVHQSGSRRESRKRFPNGSFRGGRGCGRVPFGRLGWGGLARRSFARVKLADGLADFDFGTFRNEDFESSIRFGKDFRGYFIGFDLKESLARGDNFTVFLFPAAEDSGSNRFSDGGNSDGERGGGGAHFCFFLGVSGFDFLERVGTAAKASWTS